MTPTPPKRRTAEEEAREIAIKFAKFPTGKPVYGPVWREALADSIAAALRQRDDAILAQEKTWCQALIDLDPKIIHDITKRAIETRHPLVSQVIAARRARAEEAERDRDVLAAEVQAWRSVDKSAWEFSVDLLQARSNTDASYALARAGEVKP